MPIQIGAAKTAGGRFVCEPAHGAKTQIDCARGELTGFEMSAITQDHDPVEGQVRFRAIPINELDEDYNGGPMALTSGTKLGPYEIQSPLGAGGMGEVYRARDARLNRDVAIKQSVVIPLVMLVAVAPLSASCS